MASGIEIPGSRVKLRNELAVFLLALATLGIYYLFWYYATNRELADYGAATGTQDRLGTSPGKSLLAVTVGGLLIVPPFVSEFRYFKRIKSAQEVAGMDHTISHVTGFVLYLIAVIFLPIEIAYAQHHLNRLWRHVASEQDKHDLGMRAEPAKV
jgi:hypothetical protein